MKRRWTRWGAWGTVVLACWVPGLFLGAGPAVARGSVKVAPGGFCAAMTNVADAEAKAVQHPSVATGDEAVAAIEAAAQLAPNGQIANAIAATDLYYEEMWAQDIAAMLGYHGGASAVVATAQQEAVADYVKQDCPNSATPQTTRLPPEINSGECTAVRVPGPRWEPHNVSVCTAVRCDCGARQNVHALS